MKKLYKVNINTDIVVYASNEKEAKYVAHKSIYDHLCNLSAEDYIVAQISSEEDLPEGWEADCLPYEDGHSYDISIGGILGNK